MYSGTPNHSLPLTSLIKCCSFNQPNYRPAEHIVLSRWEHLQRFQTNRLSLPLQDWTELKIELNARWSLALLIKRDRVNDYNAGITLVARRLKLFDWQRDKGQSLTQDLHTGGRRNGSKFVLKGMTPEQTIIFSICHSYTSYRSYFPWCLSPYLQTRRITGPISKHLFSLSYQRPTPCFRLSPPLGTKADSQF